MVILLRNLPSFIFSSLSTLYLEELALLMVFADDTHLQRGSSTSGNSSCLNIIWFDCSRASDSTLLSCMCLSF